jgi:hypothetical protein
MAKGRSGPSCTARRWLGLGVGLLLWAPPLGAQTLPVPVLPPERPTAPEPTASAEPPAPGAPRRPEPVEVTSARLRPWEYVLGLSAGWDHNIDFLVPHGPSGLGVVPRGAVARVFSTPQALLRTTVAAGGIGYLQRGEPRRFYTDLGLEASYRSSPSTDWHASADYGLGYSDSSRVLLEQGVSLPIVKMRSLNAALGLSRKLGARTSLRLDGRLYRTDFDSPDQIDGQSVRGTIGVQHHFDVRTSATLGYSVEPVRSAQAGRYYATHFASLQWTRLVSPRSGLLLESGASYTPEAALAALDQKGSFFGGASFTRQVKRSTFTAFVRHEVTPAFGLGVSRRDVRSGLRGAIPFGSRWDLRLTATHVEPDHGQGPTRAAASSDEALAAVVRRLGRRVELTGEGGYRRRGPAGAAPAVASFHAGVSVVLLSPSGESIALTPTR